ncbi:hypothetical protein D9M68_764420 [compost metagenome]
MNFKNPISPGVSAFVAKMRVRAAQPHGVITAQPAPVPLAWRVSPVSGRLESRELIETQIEEGLLRSRGSLRG